jgi:hypothetical protein
MKALKLFVIVMGVLIAIGLGLVVFGVSRNLQRTAAGNHPPPAGGQPAVAGYFTAELLVPAGSRLEQMAATGDRVVLRFSGDAADRILVLDARNGQLSGTITLVRESR